jgi:hypothetical protein
MTVITHREALIHKIWKAIDAARKKGKSTFLYPEEWQFRRKRFSGLPPYRVTPDGGIFATEHIVRLIDEEDEVLEISGDEVLGRIVPGQAIVQRTVTRKAIDRMHQPTSRQKKRLIYDLIIREKIFLFPHPPSLPILPYQQTRLGTNLPFFRWDIEPPIVPIGLSFREYLTHNR